MSSTGKAIIFKARSGKSWLVDIPSDLKYTNSRMAAHVETEAEILPGTRVLLGKRTVRQVDLNVAVMYEVIGIKNRGHPAHMTTYFGPAGTVADAH